MRVLLAGATGLLGKRVVPLLVAAGHDVAAVSRRSDDDERLRAAGADPLRLDVLDPAATEAAATGAGAVVNLATRIPPPERALWRRAWRANDRLRRDGSRALARAAARQGARCVQESFAATYPDHGAAWIDEDAPLAPVAQTATVPDAEASAARVTAAGGVGVVLRFGLCYGPDDRRWLDAAERGRLILPGPAERYASMVHLDDAAAAVLAALALPAGAYNVVEDDPAPVGEQADAVAAALGYERVRPLPAAAGRWPTLRTLARSHRISNRRLRQASDWAPTVPDVRRGWQQVAQELADGRDRRAA